MKTTHKGIAFNAVDAANNINGTKTRHLIRVSQNVIKPIRYKWMKEIAIPILNLQQFTEEYLNAHAPYQPGDVVYQKEKITHNANCSAIYACDSSLIVEIHNNYGSSIHIDYVDKSERGYVTAQHMPMRYARLWLQIASCTAVQVDGVWMWETIYSKTEKPIV